MSLRELDARAVDFAVSRLEQGGALATAVARSLPTWAKRAVLWPESSAHDEYDFRTGGLLVPDPNKTRYTTTSRIEEHPSLDEAAMAMLKRWLSVAPQCALVWEVYGEPRTGRPRQRSAPIGEGVRILVNVLGDDDHDFDASMFEARSGLDFAVLSRGVAVGGDGNIAHADVAEIIDGAPAMVLGAYDHESYLIFCRTPDAWKELGGVA